MITKSRSQHVGRFVSLLLMFLATLAIHGQSRPAKAKRPVAVSDSIQMTGLVASEGHIATFSPDGKRFIIVSQKGSLQNNTNEYRLLLYQTSELFRKPTPEVVLKMTSSSNGSAVRNLTWLPDNVTVAFLGENLGEVPQINTLNIRSKNLRKLTGHLEIALPSRAITKITAEDLHPVRWDSRTNIVQFNVLRNQNQTKGTVEAVYYRRNGEVWQRVDPVSETTNDIRPDIHLEQDLNVPPRIVLIDPKTNHAATLLEVNPGFAELRFGRVEEIQWSDSAGYGVSGGLYLPPDYSEGKRYPLVIQTHGYDPHAFWIDGPHTTAFAAQPLASRGIVVLQVQDIFYDSLNTPREAERVMNVYENAIEYLDRMGIIDPRRVGLIGFSRTCFYVKYALTHASRHFAAAIVSDGFDGGYFQYLIFSNSIPIRTASIETVIGVSPFGIGLSVWSKQSPGFMLDRVQTPLQVQAFGPGSLLGEWEWYSGLKRLEKPVDLAYLPAGSHILVKPWERLVSQGGSVDWFSFWLKGEEDPDPAKAEQYKRRRELRKLQEANERKSVAPPN